MSLIQCSGCQEMVDESKAYCPDCGVPMDEEQKRVGSSEYDSLMKTQNINATSQLKILEQLNVSSVFASPQIEPAEQKAEREPIKKGSQTIILQPIVDPNAFVKEPDNKFSQPKQESNPSSNSVPIEGKAPNSKKTLYAVGGVVALLIALALIAAITIGFLFWYNPK